MTKIEATRNKTRKCNEMGFEKDKKGDVKWFRTTGKDMEQEKLKVLIE